jgi:hypothetical protein
VPFLLKNRQGYLVGACLHSGMTNMKRVSSDAGEVMANMISMHMMHVLSFASQFVCPSGTSIKGKKEPKLNW